MRRLREAVAARPATLRVDPEARQRVCRNLWGKASADDSRAFAAKEMAVQRERAAERWGFDFLREVPRNCGSGPHRFKWTRVRVGSVPAVYRLPRMTLPLPPAATPAPAAPAYTLLDTARTTVLAATTPAAQPENVKPPHFNTVVSTAEDPAVKKQPTIDRKFHCWI
jgi:hypothetical protein